MKLSGAAAARYCARPDPAKAGLLLYGADAMRVALKRQEAILALVGPSAEAEMRLERLSGADLRRDPAAVTDALRAQGFFPRPARGVPRGSGRCGGARAGRGAG